jgi:uncharacterized protein (TIGR03437 family)
LSCGASSDPAILPVEGIADLVSDLVIKCQGGVPTPAGQPIPPITLRVTMNAAVTSRLLPTPVILSEALLLIDDPPPRNQLPCPTSPCSITGTGGATSPYDGSPGRYNVFQAAQPAINAVEWSGIPFDAPGSGNVRILRFTNLRANVNGFTHVNCLGCLGIQVVELVQSPGLQIDQPEQTLAYGQTGLLFESGTTVFRSTAPHNLIDPATDFTMTFTERFPDIFKPRTIGADQNIPGKSYSSTSGFYNASFTGPYEGAGLATQGTRLLARFENVPPGVGLFVTEQPIIASDSLRVQLVNTGPDGAGPYQPAFATSNGFAPIEVKNGVAIAAWEVTAASPAATEKAQFGVALSFTADPSRPLLQAGMTTVRGSLGPVSAVTIPSMTEPAPRYAENPPQPAFKIGAHVVSAVVNAADFARDAPMEPGSIAAIFGIGLTSPDGPTVRINGIPAPVFAATDTQVNIQIPWEVAVGRSPASLTVTVNGVDSDPAPINLIDIAPHIFVVEGQPVPGNTLTIYGTGFGPVENHPPTGSAATDFNSITLTPPTVVIGGKAAQVTYSGLAPGYVGLWEITATMPDVAIGSGVPLQIYIGSQAASNTVLLRP